MPLTAEIDAALSPAEIARLPSLDLSETTCVVFDVLRATSSMITGLAHGVREIVPVCTIEEALAEKARRPHALLAGERHGDPIEGFALGNSPFEYQNVSGRSIISTTTNGTIALRACDGAERTLAAAILNLSATAEALQCWQPKRILLVCAGTFETFALEDAWAAGRLIQLLAGAALTDSAQALLALAQAQPDPLAALQTARNGRALHAKGRGAEVEWCARESCFQVVGVVEDCAVRPLSAGAGSPKG